MRKSILLSFLFNCFITAAQKQISGRVISEETKTPLAGASVFISSTSKGTVADKEGNFILRNLPEGQQELVISSVGYETYTYIFSDKQLPLDLSVISLKVKSKQLEEVTVGPAADEDGWTKWGSFFMSQFIGNTRFAQECSFINSGALKFRYREATQKLTAWADEPLVIENKEMGYIIHYKLENFVVDFLNNKMQFLGYPLFEEMKDENGKRKEKWERNRLKAWKGSMKHFMKAAYDNKLQEEGFEVQQFSWTNENTGKNSMYAANMSDSVILVNNLFNQGGYFGRKEMPLMSAADFMQSAPGENKILSFKGFLYVVYKNDLEELNYFKSSPNQKKRSVQRSVIFLTDVKEPVQADSKGNYYPPKEVFSLGYWAWREKIAELLPLEYIPAENKIPGK